MFVTFFDGLVPCSKWARALRKSGHSDCVISQAARLMKGNLHLLSKTSCTDIFLTTHSSDSEINEQIWQDLLSHSAGFRLPKSDNALSIPAIWHTEAWNRLTTVKYVLSLGLAEKSPLHSFSYALTPQTRGEYIYYIGFITLSDHCILYKPAMVLTMPPTELYLIASHYVDFNILL